jgi:hypothetical protein
MYAGRLDLPPEIDQSTMIGELECGAALISHCLATFALIERNPEIGKAQRIIAWIFRRRSPFFTARECFRAHQTLFTRMTSMMPTLTLLEQHGYIRIDRQGSSGGRPPSELCEVNPAILGRATA